MHLVTIKKFVHDKYCQLKMYVCMYIERTYICWLDSIDALVMYVYVGITLVFEKRTPRKLRTSPVLLTVILLLIKTT